MLDQIIIAIAILAACAVTGWWVRRASEPTTALGEKLAAFRAKAAAEPGEFIPVDQDTLDAIARIMRDAAFSARARTSLELIEAETAREHREWVEQYWREKQPHVEREVTHDCPRCSDPTPHDRAVVDITRIASTHGVDLADVAQVNLFIGLREYGHLHTTAGAE